MKKTLISVILILGMLFATNIIPVQAHKGTGFEYDFNDYTSTDGLTAPNGFTASGFFDKTAENGTYATVKSVDLGGEHGSVMAIATNKSCYAQVNKSVMIDENTSLTGSVELKTSIYLEDNWCRRVIYFYGTGYSDYVMFGVDYLNNGGSVVSFCGKSVGDTYRLPAKQWFDVIIKYDTYSKKANLQIIDEFGNCVLEASDTAAIGGNDLKTVSYAIRTSYYQTEGSVDAIMYVDDMSVKGINRFYDLEWNYDFETFERTAHKAYASDGNYYVTDGSNGLRIIYANDNSANTGNTYKGEIVQVETERGKSAKLIQYQKNANRNAVVISKNFQDWDNSWNLYNFPGTPVTTVLDMSAALKFDDFKTSKAIFVDGIANANAVMLSSTNGKLKFLTTYIDESEFKFEIDKWYDINIRFDVQNKNVKLDIYQNGNLEFTAVSAIPAELDILYALEKINSCAVGGYIYDELKAENGPSIFYVDDLKITKGEPVLLFGEENAETFAIASSTPSSSSKVKASTPIKVTFNNLIATDSFNSETVVVKENGTAIASQISFDDDAHSILIDADIKEDKAYTIEFVSVSDSDGKTLTDFVEFETYKKALTIAQPEVLTEGLKNTVTSKVDSNDGFEYKIAYYVALYEDNELIGIKTFAGDVYPGFELAINAELIMPETRKENATYNIKAFCWDGSSIKPLADDFVKSID